MLAGLLLVILGLVSLWGARYWMRLRRQVNAWPVVRGHVTARHAIQPTDRGRTSAPAFRWAPDVRFSYRVDDTDYIGEKFWPPWSWTHTKASAEAFLVTIPDEVDVRYDPTDPQTSCLYPPPYGNVLWYGIPGLVLLGVGGLILLVQAVGGRPSRAARSGAGARTVHTCASGRVA